MEVIIPLVLKRKVDNGLLYIPILWVTTSRRNRSGKVVGI